MLVEYYTLRYVLQTFARIFNYTIVQLFSLTSTIF